MTVFCRVQHRTLICTPVEARDNQNLHSELTLNLNYCDMMQKSVPRTGHLPPGDLAGAPPHTERLERPNPPPSHVPLEQAGATSRAIP